jgi:hypothetical protein
MLIVVAELNGEFIKNGGKISGRYQPVWDT